MFYYFSSTNEDFSFGWSGLHKLQFFVHKIHALKTVLEQTYILLIITSYSGRNCTKSVLKPLAAKNDLSISVMCTAPFQ